nr:MAG TPA: hypothetical protein [Caudoviricetes sp.]
MVGVIFSSTPHKVTNFIVRFILIYVIYLR